MSGAAQRAKMDASAAVEDSATWARNHAMRAAGATAADMADALTATGMPTVRSSASAAAIILGMGRRHPLQAQREVAYMIDARLLTPDDVAGRLP